MRKMRRSLCLVMTAAMAILCLGACGKDKVPNAADASYDEVVSYLKDGGVIADENGAIDINTAEGYVTDNTGGDFTVAQVADKAYDYDGLWLFWWDAANESDLYLENFQYIEMNGGVIVIAGGAAVIETSAYGGSYAIAFAEDYAKKDEALKLFNAMVQE